MKFWRNPIFYFSLFSATIYKDKFDLEWRTGSLTHFQASRRIIQYGKPVP